MAKMKTNLKTMKLKKHKMSEGEVFKKVNNVSENELNRINKDVLSEMR